MSYFRTDDDGGTLWQSLGPDDPDPKPLLSRRGSTTALWQLALRGAGLDEQQAETPRFVTADPWLCRCAAAELGPGQHESYCGQADDDYPVLELRR